MRSPGRVTIAAALWLATCVAAGAQGTASGDAFPAGGIADVLKARTGKPVSLHLRSGKDVAGTVGEVRNDAVVVTRLSGREFYDAIVRLDDVVAVELRMRDR